MPKKRAPSSTSEADAPDEKQVKKRAPAAPPKPWTEAEQMEALILVLAHSDVKTGAGLYRLMGEKLGRTPKSIENWWLGKIKKQIEQARGSGSQPAQE